MKVRITKSNCNFVKVGEVTEILDSASGHKLLWSNSFLYYEKLSWVENFWGVQYEELKDEQESDI